MSTPAPEFEDAVDNPLLPGDQEYTVRLLFRVQANNPTHAVMRFIDQINENGLNNWTYRVVKMEGDEDNEGTEQWLVTQGIEQTPEEFAQSVEDGEDEDGEGDAGQ